MSDRFHFIPPEDFDLDPEPLWALVGTVRRGHTTISSAWICRRCGAATSTFADPHRAPDRCARCEATS